MKPSYEELETELLKSIKEIAPDFRKEWMPYLMLRPSGRRGVWDREEG